MMMRNSCSIILVLASIVTFTFTQDVSRFLQNRNIVDNEIACILRRSSCDIIGNQIKAILPEALNNNCARCTPQQAQNAKKLMAFMKQNYPTEWNLIVQMYQK